MKSKKKRFDILGLGTVAIDELIAVEKYPAADVKTRVLRTERQCGGLTAGALVAASRAGARCAYAGVLGRDDFSKFAAHQMREENINLSHLRFHTEALPVHSFIVVDINRHTRNVFSHRASAYRLPSNWPPASLIASSKVLFVDHSDPSSMLRAVKMARRAGVAVVADLERDSGDGFVELIDAIDHLILSESFALAFTNSVRVSEALTKLWNSSREVVAITCGERGCYYLERSYPQKIRHQRAFAMNAIDTTGCGDVFHGAYAAALAEGQTMEDRFLFATAAAALKTRKLGSSGTPTRPAILKFLREQKNGGKD